MQNSIAPKYIFPILLLCVVLGSATVFGAHSIRGIFDFSDVSTKVFLPPRMNTEQMNQISSISIPYLDPESAEGLTVYNTDTDSLNFWNGSEWKDGVNPDSDSTIPSASVIMWFGSTGPPAGWKYCDGSNTGGGDYAYDTPNMIGRFPRGASPTDPTAVLGAIGGNSRISFDVQDSGSFPQLGFVGTQALEFTGTDGFTSGKLCTSGGTLTGCNNLGSISILPPYIALHYICMI